MAFEAALVVMAAGMGSRFGGLKQVEPVGPKGEAILDYSVYDAKRAGFTKVVFVIKHQIEEEFKRLVGSRVEKQIPVEYVFQETDLLPEGYTCPPGREKPWGTGQAVWCCKDVVDVPFAVINADDFYGAQSYRQIIRGLQEKNSCCMVGFRLGNTVTENGTVSRGVCKIENGMLKEINEHTKIDSACRCEGEDGEQIQLARNTVVSMNMWGMYPDVFPYFEEEFKKFLDENIKSPKAEFYLPSVIDRMIHSHIKEVKALVAEEKWYGVTYREDKEMVVNAIRRLVEEGKYEGF